MKPLFTALGGILMLAAAPAGAQTQPPGTGTEWPRTMYACRHYGPLEGIGGTLEFDILFTAEGAVFSETAKWSASFYPPGRSPFAPTVADTIVRVQRDPNDGWITIGWPGDNAWDKSPASADPADKAVIRISSFALFRQAFRKKERWRQAIIARGSEVLVARDGEDHILLLSPLEPALVSDFGPVSDMLTMPIANLLAWGSGRDTLTVYDVFVQPRKYVANAFPNGPAGKMRIVGEYRVDIAALADAWARARAQHAAWRAGLTDAKAMCAPTQVDDPSATIIVN